MKNPFASYFKKKKLASLFAKADTEKSSSNYQAAIETFAHILSLDITAAEKTQVYSERGLCYQSLNNIEMCITDFEAAITTGTINEKLNVYSLLTDIYKQQKRWDKVIECQTNQINLSDKEYYYNLRANTYFYQTKNYSAAIEDYSRALYFINLLYPEDRLKAYINRGISNSYLKQYESAEADFSKALLLCTSTNTRYPEKEKLRINSLLAEIYCTTGYYEAEHECYKIMIIIGEKYSLSPNELLQAAKGAIKLTNFYLEIPDNVMASRYVMMACNLYKRANTMPGVELLALLNKLAPYANEVNKLFLQLCDTRTKTYANDVIKNPNIEAKTTLTNNISLFAPVTKSLGEEEFKEQPEVKLSHLIP